MSYSEYRFEDINGRDYSEACKILFSLAPNEDVKRKLESILYLGEYNGVGFVSSIGMRGDYNTEAKRRLSMAYLLLRNPSTLAVITKNNVYLFHGTNGNALPSIIKNGLMPGTIMESNGIQVLTGEKSTRLVEQRNYVSFTDVLDLAIEYANILPSEGNNELLSFPVVIGVTDQDAREGRICTVPSDLPEIGVTRELPPQKIKIILVPSDKVKFVKKIINNDEIIVVGMDDMSERFYYMNEYGYVDFDKERLQILRDNLLKENKKFSLAELKELVLRKGMQKYGR